MLMISCEPGLCRRLDLIPLFCLLFCPYAYPIIMLKLSIIDIIRAAKLYEIDDGEPKTSLCKSHTVRARILYLTCEMNRYTVFHS